MTWQEKLRQDLLQAGAAPNSFSIDKPEKFVMNLAKVADGYKVWFQNADGEFEAKVYPTIGEAVYELAARLLPGREAARLAAEWHDDKLVLYPGWKV